MSSYKWFVVSDSISVLVVLHEEDVSDVELPGLMLTTELSRLSEDLFNLGIVGFVPVSLGLHHQDWNVLVKSGIVLLEGLSYGFRVSGNSSILNGLGLFTKGVNMLVGQIFKFGICFILRRLVEDEGFKEFKIFS